MWGWRSYLCAGGEKERFWKGVWKGVWRDEMSGVSDCWRYRARV